MRNGLLSRSLLRRAPGGAQGEQGMLAAVGGTAVSKLVVMGLSGLLGIVTSKIIIAHFGVDLYAQYGLLTSLPGLLPFADLGIAAVVINAVAESKDPRSDPYVLRTITTAFRILIASSSIIVLLAIGISLLGWWPAILGTGLSPTLPTAALLCMVVFGVTLPLTIGQRILVGLGKTSTQVASQVVFSPFMFLSIGAVALFSLPFGGYISVFSYIAGGLVSIICLVAVARDLGKQVATAFRDVPRVRTVKGVPAIGLAWPMLLQMIVLPIAMQTDRLLLSHLTHGPELAEYNLASQLFGIVLQTIAAAGIAFWPIFARARASGRIRSPLVPTGWFALGGLAVGTALALLSPLLALFVSGGKITLDPWLVWGFVAFVVVQAAKYPIGMYMTDKKGLTFQVVPIFILLPINLGLSFWLVGVVGAGGPIIGSMVATLLCQVIPNLWFVRRDMRRRAQLAEAEPKLEPEPEPEPVEK